MAEPTELTVTALTILYELVKARNEVTTVPEGEFSDDEAVRDFLFKDDTGMWAKADALVAKVDRG